MSANSRSAEELPGSLSRDKKALLKSLLAQRNTRVPPIKPHVRHDSNEQSRFPLSWAQQRLWFIDRLEGGSAAYHVPVGMRLQGELDVTALQRAIERVIERHESLRTVFVEMDGEPMQKIEAQSGFHLQRLDLSTMGQQRREQALQERLREGLAAPFELSTGPLIRGSLVKLSDQEHVLLITMHHIVSDGWSVGVLIKELGALYEAYRQGQGDPLSALPIQYGDYAQWQRQWLSGAELERQLKYWREHLEGAPELLELPTDRRRAAVQSYRGGNVEVALDEQLTRQLKLLSRRHDATLAMTLYTGWSVLLSRLSGQRDLVVGMPVANRRRTELEGLIGFFVNTLAVRVSMEDDPTVQELLGRVKEVMLGAYAHQDVPFEEVVKVLQPTRSLSHSPIFQVTFVLQTGGRDALQLANLDLVEQEVPRELSQFDLTLSVRDSGERICGTLNYASDLFDASTMARWAKCFECVLRAMVSEPELRISRVPLMSAEERTTVLQGFNATQATYPTHKLIHELFEEQVERTPHAIAVMYEDQTLKYAELEARANQLARHLLDCGAGPERLVGICLDRSIDLVLAVLATLKAGSAYVPLDPDYPPERLKHMLTDAAPVVLLTSAELMPRVPNTTARVVALDECREAIARQPAERIDSSAITHRVDQLAYVIYTSGSTGLPKGVMIEHGDVVNLWFGLEALYAQSRPCERVACNASFNFDASVQQWVQLLSGRTLLVIPQYWRRDPALLVRCLEQHRIDEIDCTPSQLRAWIAAGLLESDRWRPAVVLVGGEAIDPEMWKTLASCRETQFFNVYGPTECTVDSTAAHLNGDDTAPHIGQPMKNRCIYILDQHGEPVPVGVPGEIYIGGAGVARGYLGRPALTEERFVVDRFSNSATARMYKTGDLGRWRADGAIEYLGRNDSQVKIRGFRIELGEIEAQLARHEQIQDAIVIVRQDGGTEQRLIGYVTRRPGGIAGPEELRTYLKSVLPDYMVPSAIVALDRMPLTRSGKVDRQALPQPELAAFASRTYEVPHGEIEEILAGIWQGLLRIERVGRHDNFFELGGHSLLIVHMMERLRRFGLATEVRRVFESPTLKDLAAALRREQREQFAPPPNLIPPGCTTITPQMLPLVELQPEHIESIVQTVPGGAANVQDIYPLAPLQEGILFHHVLNGGRRDVYVLRTLLVVDSRARLDQLAAALQTAVDRHDVLRTAVLWERLPRPVQVVYRQAKLEVEQVALDPGRSVLDQVQSWLDSNDEAFDLRHAPHLHLLVAPDVDTGKWYVVVQMHHILTDNTSRQLVVREVVACLQGAGGPVLESIPYRNHVAHVLASSHVQDAAQFFQGKLADFDETTAPFGLLNVYGDGTDVVEVEQDIEPVLAQRIRAQARGLGVSAATLFHAAWALVVAHTSGRDDVVFGTVLLGRMQGSVGAADVLGLFINTLPMRLRLAGVSARALVEQTQRELIELLSHEHAPLATAKQCSGLSSAAPVFTALFNYRHGSRDSAVSWEGAGGIQVLAGKAATNYPLMLAVDDFGDGFRLSAQTDRRIDPNRLMAYLRTSVLSLTDALLETPDTAALNLSILPPEEWSKVIEELNATRVESRQDRLVHDLFEEQVRRTPHAVALLHAGRSVTYEQLDAKAEQLACYLQNQGVGPDRLIGVCMERSVEMVVALLGILKAGGAYLPLDPNYPPERLRYMLEDAAPHIVLTQEKLRAILPGTQAPVLAIDTAEQEIAASVADGPALRPAALSPWNLVYTIYTSGSTGRPKGTTMSHGAMVNLIEWHRRRLPLRQGQRVLQFAALSFDVAFQEIFSTLCDGGALVLLSEWVRRDARALLQFVVDNAVERMFVPPLMLQAMAESQVSSDTAPQSLREVITAGEQLCISAQIVDFFQRVRGCRLHNHYGPTETHVVTALTLPADPRCWPTLPTIGQPIDNARIYILDPQGRPVPFGAIGEIYIAGANVARGYLRRPDVTAQRFVADIFSKDSSARMYRSGDLGRWCADGSIEYLGRNDAQVKIRGFRIEPGEIEAQLATHEKVREVAVVAREDVPGERRLVAYVTCSAGAVPSAEELRTHAQAELPQHMVPSAFVMIEKMPLTPSGKLDRRALPAPELTAYASKHYEAPSGEIEAALAQIWAELLKLQRIGRNDDFFELGGHSLLATRVVAHVAHSLDIDVPLRVLFERPTIRALGDYIVQEIATEVFMEE